ncbi:hypothetical protein LTR96_004125 [Exophiala xenobiotica]|nr:hypothetical protein LTR96_004125 [Exophiala xenobiotica]KAK5300907.1 hypothetical protein LTR14_001305 [Exophiala xenobiotica]KAK5360240.1 hypothetical protein LTS13_010330 [Exophiala xenobiotica]KAK5421538.1 hypothetical protein LTR90_003028 [Exophiala xenobiotica]
MPPLCVDCEKLTIDTLRDQEVPLKEDLAALIDSARNGCTFCSMCWIQFQKDCSSDTIQRHLRGDFGPSEKSADWRIYLNAELHENVSRNPNLRISWTQQMLSKCQRWHPRCGKSYDQIMPTRVIDVGYPPDESAPFLFATEGRAGKYIALSYCWGDGVKPEVKLRKATYDSMLMRIDEERMSRTHREALQVARELGFQYLWIDAICIIQDSLEDWQSESAKMTEVYGNAELTLVAGRNGDSNKGFINNPFVPAMPPHQLEYTHPAYPQEEQNVCYVTLPRNLDRGRVEDRAWCFQESILSRRSIVYGVEQLSFQCQEGLFCEDGTVALREANKEGRYILSEPPTNKIEFSAAKETLLRRWYDMVDRYSMRGIYDPHDIFAALAGIAKAVQKTLRCRYIAGLWEDDLIRGLLWHSRNDTLPFPPGGRYQALKRPTERNAKKPHALGQIALRAPSWSWASVEGPVFTSSFHRPDKYRQKYRTAANFRIRPALEHPRRWTNNGSCDVQQMWMPECELEVFGALVGVRCSNQTVSDYAKRTKWWYSPAKIAMHGVLLVASDHQPERVVGVGLFDVPDEKVSPLSCMRIIKEEGLMLQRDEWGKYHRLGIFVVEDEEWFDAAPERKVSLV